MPASRKAFTSGALPVVVSLVLLASGAALSARAASAAGEAVENSSLDASLFYQLLLGEIELRDGQAGTAYQLMMDAARRTKDEQVFRRATEIALQARAGDQALSATQAWRQAVPASDDALRYQIQILVAMNRIADVEEPLALLLQRSARPSLPAVIEALPRFLARAADHGATAALIERVLRPYADAADTKASTPPRRSPSRSVRAMPIRRPRAQRSSPSTCCRQRPTLRRSSSASSPPARRARTCGCSMCERWRRRSGCRRLRRRSPC
jgi:hypothetical protein